MNVELAEKVIDHIRMLEIDPYSTDTYNMNSFGTKTSCGTSACLAGWTAYLVDPINYMKSINDNFKNWEESRVYDTEIVARNHLDITFSQAEAMFYAMSATIDQHALAFKLIEANPSIKHYELRCKAYGYEGSEYDSEWDDESSAESDE